MTVGAVWYLNKRKVRKDLDLVKISNHSSVNVEKTSQKKFHILSVFKIARMTPRCSVIHTPESSLISTDALNQKIKEISSKMADTCWVYFSIENLNLLHYK